MMLASYFKIAFRNLLRNKGFSLISILGMAASMSVCLVIIVFVKHQWSYDSFHGKAERIFHIYSDYKAPVNSTSHLYATSPHGLGEIMSQEIPEVINYLTLRHYNGSVLQGTESVDIRGLYASDAFFDLLDFKLLSGDPKTALSEPNSLVITKSAAAKLFGNQDVMGQVVAIAGQGEFKVTGVVADATQPSLIDFEVLASMATLQSDSRMRERLNFWDRTVRSSYTLVLLRKAEAASLLAQLPKIIDQHFPGDEASHLAGLHLQKLTDMAAGPFMDNQLKMVLPGVALLILAALAGVILLAACFNYVSLSVARALRRAREVGVRKVVGAGRSQIVGQFLVEAICMSGLALIVAVGLLGWLVDGFNSLTPVQFTGSQVSPEWTDSGLYAIFLFFSLCVGLLSGLYPALYLSRFMPALVLKGISKIGSKGFTLRRMLIVGQFALSLIFIISTLLLYQQSQHLSQTDYGFNPTNVLNVELAEVPYETLRQKLLSHPGVVNVSAQSVETGSGSRSDTWLQSQHLPEHEKGYSVWIDENLLPNLEIPIIAGRNFSREYGAEAQQSVLLNEAAVRRLKLGKPLDAVGQFITVDDELQMQVIGVVKDYRYFSALDDIDPLVLRMNSEELEVANIRFHPEGYSAVIAHLNTTWQALASGKPPQYHLYQDHLAEAMELKLMRDFLHIVGLAAGFAILIACLGLLGMTAYMMETQLKEIGVRKVLGATTSDMVAMLSKSFLTLTLLAAGLTAPLAWFINNLWLQHLGNRVEMSPRLFLVSILLVLLIAAITIGSQTLRAARIKPTAILKYE